MFVWWATRKCQLFQIENWVVRTPGKHIQNWRRIFPSRYLSVDNQALICRLVFLASILFVAASPKTKHWLFQLQRLFWNDEQTHAFQLNRKRKREGKKRKEKWCVLARQLRSRSHIFKIKCLQVEDPGVATAPLTLVLCNEIFWDGSVLQGFKCTSDICLRTCRGHSSHSSEVYVCRGHGPPSHQCGLRHTYLPVKSFIPLITGQWLYQQNCIRCFSTCFLHRWYGLLYW